MDFSRLVVCIPLEPKAMLHHPFFIHEVDAPIQALAPEAALKFIV
jgi:hypothetical protein